MSNTLWVEKYRPSNLDTYIGNEHLKSKVSMYLESGDLPHLLLYGRAGTGKTTLAKLLVKNIECDYLYINASDENNVETVRTKVKGFASTIGFKDMKVIIPVYPDHRVPRCEAYTGTLCSDVIGAGDMYDFVVVHFVSLLCLTLNTFPATSRLGSPRNSLKAF